MPTSVAKRVQIEQAGAIDAMLKAAADRHNCDLEACLGVHLQTPSPDARPAGLPDFDTPPPVEPRYEGISILDKILLRGAEMERRHVDLRVAQNLAEAAGSHKLSRRDRMRIAADLCAALHDAVGLLHRVHGQNQLLHIHGQRLFDVGVLACPRGRGELGAMLVVRRADDDGVHVLAVEFLEDLADVVFGELLAVDFGAKDIEGFLNPIGLFHHFPEQIGVHLLLQISQVEHVYLAFEDGIGDAAGALKKYEEAKGMIKEERQAPLWMQIGKAQGKLNQEEAAVAAFKKAMALAPADKLGEYRNAFAQFYLDGKKFDEAIGLLADPKAEGSPEQVLMDLAKTWKNKEPNFAIAALEKVLKLNPANADAHFDLGQLYYIDGKSKDSRTKELLNKYVEIGKDADKIQSAKDMLVIVNKRSK